MPRTAAKKEPTASALVFSRFAEAWRLCLIMHPRLGMLDAEWAEFLGHFERRKVAVGDCGRAYGTSGPHEHSCVRCPVLRIGPGQRPRLAAIRDNLTARIDEAEREGWLGEAEGLRVSLAAARGKLARLDEPARRAVTVSLGIPAYRDIAARTATLPGNLP